MNEKTDKGLVLTILFLIGLGVVQVYSSSYIYAIESMNDGLYFFRRQLIFSLLGIVTLFVVYKIPHKHMVKFGMFLFVMALGGVVLTLVPSMTIKAGGAHRWVQLPFGQRFEPAELMKYSLPFFAGLFVIPKAKGRSNWVKGIFLALIAGILAMFLKQPDFGSAVICSLIVLAMAFCFGLKWRYLFGGALAAAPLVYFFVVNVPYRYARIMAFLDPWADPQNKGFQIIQSMLSYYSGGWNGVGLGQGQGKLFFLPEAHTDFTLSVLAEEMGFLGFAMVLLLFGFVIYKGFQISLNSEKAYDKAVAIGITTAFSLGVVVNTGVTLGMLPTKGLSLPFLSYGGSSLISICIGLGFLLNIEKVNRIKRSRSNFSGIKIK